MEDVPFEVEINALAIAWGALKDLNIEQQRRALNYLRDRFESEHESASKPTTPEGK